MKMLDVVGHHYGMLEVLNYSGLGKKGAVFSCRCDFRNIILRTSSSLKNSTSFNFTSFHKLLEFRLF